MDYEHEPRTVEVLFFFLLPVTLVAIAIMLFVYALMWPQ
jgi:hypothetical protein